MYVCGVAGSSLIEIHYSCVASSMKLKCNCCSSAVVVLLVHCNASVCGVCIALHFTMVPCTSGSVPSPSQCKASEKDPSW